MCKKNDNFYSNTLDFLEQQFILLSNSSKRKINLLNPPKLPISKYRFTLEAVDSITLPTYKGSSFHGGFGHALKQISPTWFKYFYQPESPRNLDLPRPYVILPPLDKLEHYPKGHQFHLEITLIGEATQHYAIVQAAVEYLGLRMGLGGRKGKYKVISIDRAIAGTHTEETSKHSVNSDEIIKARTPMLPTDRITIHFPTRLRLKHRNKLCRKPPEFSIIFDRIAGRLKTLSNAYGEKDKQLDYKALTEQAKNITIHQQNLHWQDWHRYSGTSKESMNFGGLTGEITYQGNVTAFLPWLVLGEWVHIGGKTSFGLGKYIIRNNQQEV